MSLAPIRTVKTFAAIGGWNLLEKVVWPLMKSLFARWTEKGDQAVWEIIRQPKPKVFGTQGGKPLIDRRQEDPYTLEEIASLTGRSNRSVLRSLRRLEKRNKVKELHNGWMRAQK